MYYSIQGPFSNTENSFGCKLSINEIPFEEYLPAEVMEELLLEKYEKNPELYSRINFNFHGLTNGTKLSRLFYNTDISTAGTTQSNRFSQEVDIIATPLFFETFQIG